MSALIFSREPNAWLRTGWQTGRFVPLAGNATAAELIRVLSYPKFKLCSTDIRLLLADYLPWCEAISVPEHIAVPDCQDPHDRAFLALALAGGADFLITGDKDLLDLSGSFAIPIVTLAHFRQALPP